MNYRDLALARNPVFLWMLDEASGATVVQDHGSNNLDGTVVGACTFGANGMSKRLGESACDQTAEAAYVWRASDALLNPVGAFSYGGWFQTMSSTLGGDNVEWLLMKPWTSHTAPHYCWSIARTSTTWYANFSRGTTGGVPNGNLVLGRWYFLFVTYDGRYLKLYQDGVLKLTHDFGSVANVAGGTGQLGLGANMNLTATNYGWVGRVQGVGMWNSLFTDTDVRAMYEVGVTGLSVVGPGCYGTSAYGTAPYAGGTGGGLIVQAVQGTGTADVTLSSAATGGLLFRSTATAAVTITTDALATMRLHGSAWTADETQGLFFRFSSSASGRVNVPVSHPTSPFVVSDAETTSGSNVVTSDIGGFTPEDEGRPISGPGIPPNTTILSVIDGHTVTMSNVATATSPGVEVTVSRSLIKIVPIWRRSVTMPDPVLDAFGRPT